MLLAGCDNAFTTRVDVAARAGGSELPVTTLAEILAQNAELPLRRDVAEGVALLWVDYTLFADRLLAGDSMLDSATVVRATWPDVQQLVASAYHQHLFGDSVNLDSADLDSVYRAGEYRFIQHVLFHVAEDQSDDIRQAKRRQAEYVLGQLRRGEVTWEEAASVTDEPGAAERQGTLGVIGRGETVEAFEAAAYALEPGGISPVTPTRFGYHIVHRPELGAVRDAFRSGVEERIEQNFDSLYLASLGEKWNIRVRSGAVPAVREMALDPVRAKQSSKVIGTYRGGEFRIRDLARWLQGMDPRVRQGISMGTDDQIEDMVHTLIRNEVLIREAREAGIHLTPDDIAQLTDQLRRRIALVAAAFGLRGDTLKALRARPPEEAKQTAHARVTEYLHSVSRENKTLRTVPPFLGDHLREQARWDLVPAGIERAVNLARDLRTQIDSVRSARPSRMVAPPTREPARPESLPRVPQAPVPDSGGP